MMLAPARSKPQNANVSATANPTTPTLQVAVVIDNARAAVRLLARIRQAQHLDCADALAQAIDQAGLGDLDLQGLVGQQLSC